MLQNLLSKLQSTDLISPLYLPELRRVMCYKSAQGLVGPLELDLTTTAVQQFRL